MKRLHLNSISIHKIEDTRARNILRGIINETDSYKFKNALSKIENKCSKLIYKQSLEVIRESHLFENNTFTRDFNKVCPLSLDTLVRFSNDEIIKKINANEKQLLDLLTLYKNVLKKINLQEFSGALKSSELIIKNGGVSSFLVRILFFITNHTENNSKYDLLQEEINNLFLKIQLSNVGYLETAIRELSNPRTDYFNICNKIYSNKSRTPIQYISKDYIYHTVKTESEFLDKLSSYYSFSLLDAFLFHQSSIRLNLPFIKDSVSLTLIDSYNQLASVELSSSFHFTEYDDCMDISFFRGCFLLIELNDFFKYKTIHASLYNKNESKKEERLPIEKELIERYFSDIKSLGELRSSEPDYCTVNINKYNKARCNNFENSNALNYFLEKRDADIKNNEGIFVELMSTTMDIGFTCPLHYLNKLNINAKTNHLKLVLACLISSKDNSQISEHNLRKTIQEIVISDYNYNLTELVETLYKISPSVTQHLINICDETFLSKLFHIIEKPNEAINDRAKILEWYGNITDETAYIDRAKNLRIDVQINREKGTIDDHRIYVDPLKFSQWINDNILNDLTLLLEVAINRGIAEPVNIKWENIKNGINNNEQIAASFVRCYEEFCNNKLFGIASYLGRRIRHGTFKGTGLKDVQDICNEKKYRNLFSLRDFSDYYNQWISTYEEMLETLKTSHLHIKCKKKPLGKINIDINTNYKRKVANRYFDEIINSYIKNDGNIEIPYLITEGCWLLIEEDLVNIRKLLMESKSKYGVFNYGGNLEESSYIKGLLSSFSQELNSLSADKFRTISSWFNKPSIASPSANLVLLFKAVVSEIKGYFNDYTPEIISDDNDVVISGGVYFIIYDALYILIYNAAKYGKKTGLLELQISVDDENKVMNISIVSDPKDDDKNCSYAKKLILHALSEDFKNANVIEGRSGIKKLNKMAEDKLIHNIKYGFDDNKVTASFHFNLDI